MEHKQESTKKSKTSKIIWITIVAILIVLIIVVMLVLKLNKKTNNIENIDTSLLGTYSYEGDTKYKFDKNGRAISPQELYARFKIEDSKLIIDFDDEHVHDATYSYQLDNNSLKLVGEEGTAGGEYILYKD